MKAEIYRNEANGQVERGRAEEDKNRATGQTSWVTKTSSEQNCKLAGKKV